MVPRIASLFVRDLRYNAARMSLGRQWSKNPKSDMSLKWLITFKSKGFSNDLTANCQTRKSTPLCYCAGVSWPYKCHTTLGNNLVVPEPRALMYLAGPKASSSRTSSTSRRRWSQLRPHADSWEAVCCGRAGRGNSFYGPFTDLLRIQNSFFSLSFRFLCLIPSAEPLWSHALIYLLPCPDDRAPRRHTHSIPPHYV
jgi:hypothetical protein